MVKLRLFYEVNIYSYSQVQNRNGSYIDDLWLYYVMPSWLCPFTYEKYFLDPRK